jgi:divalent metal cation (Fe/Co/Zn/Cd) transporter
MRTLWRYGAPRLIMGAIVMVLVGFAAALSGLAAILSALPRDARPAALVIVVVVVFGVVVLTIRTLWKRRSTDSLKQPDQTA